VCPVGLPGLTPLGGARPPCGFPPPHPPNTRGGGGGGGAPNKVTLESAARLMVAAGMGDLACGARPSLLLPAWPLLWCTVVSYAVMRGAVLCCAVWGGGQAYSSVDSLAARLQRVETSLFGTAPPPLGGWGALPEAAPSPASADSRTIGPSSSDSGSGGDSSSGAASAAGVPAVGAGGAASATAGAPSVAGLAPVGEPPSACQRLQTLIRTMEDRVPVDVRLVLTDCEQSVLCRVPVEPLSGRGAAELAASLAACAPDVRAVAAQLKAVRELCDVVLESSRIAGSPRVLVWVCG
jgi:hypothetical protein